MLVLLSVSSYCDKSNGACFLEVETAAARSFISYIILLLTTTAIVSMYVCMYLVGVYVRQTIAHDSVIQLFFRILKCWFAWSEIHFIAEYIQYILHTCTSFRLDSSLYASSVAFCSLKPERERPYIVSVDDFLRTLPPLWLCMYVYICVRMLAENCVLYGYGYGSTALLSYSSRDLHTVYE